MITVTFDIEKEKVKDYRDRLMKVSDPYDALKMIEKTVDFAKFNAMNNGKNEFYKGMHLSLFPIKIIYDLFPELMEVYCLMLAREGGNDTSHYSTSRRNFIRDNGLEKDFKNYLKERGITEEEYYIEFLTRCYVQEYTIMAQLIDERPAAVSPQVDPIVNLQHLNSILIPAQQIVTENNVYALV